MTTSRSRALLTILLVSTGCASSPQSSTPDVIQTRRPVDTGASGLQGGALRSVTEDFVRSTAIEATADQVWRVLPAVYEEFKLPVGTLVTAERRIAAANARFRERVAGERAARIVSCGTASDGREAADSYELTLDIATVATPVEGGKTDVKSVVSGMAKPVFTNGEPVRCASTGRLEERIAAAVQARLAK